MDKYGYVLKKSQTDKKTGGHYHKADLMLMTSFQLREICQREKIIQGVINPMDKEELIRVILRYRGADEHFLIQKEKEDGVRAIEETLQKTELQEGRDLNLRCSSKIVAYQGLSIDFFDELTIPYDQRLAGTNAIVVGGDMTVCGILNIVPMGTETGCLYIVKAAELPCRESEVKNYSLYCMARRESDLIY